MALVDRHYLFSIDIFTSPCEQLWPGDEALARLFSRYLAHAEVSPAAPAFYDGET